MTATVSSVGLLGLLRSESVVNESDLNNVIFQPRESDGCDHTVAAALLKAARSSSSRKSPGRW
ncbi:hypothetical protein [Corynebacterium appendicis]|uniref:hypothetical protein n=1 Tax=Corynebacterium appendicis TaxID=163202 RepID=UPI0023542CAE|nr:hypothetical protein [Corynebacterium appendicis]